MSALIKVAALPFRLLWSLLRLFVAPTLAVALVWLVAGPSSPWFIGACLLAGVYLLGMVKLWAIGAEGVLTSLARGPVEITDTRRRARKSRKGAVR